MNRFARPIHCLAIAICFVLGAARATADARPVVRTKASPAVMERIKLARDAITFTKREIPKQGNMRPVVHATKGNSHRRMSLTRQISPSLATRSTSYAAAVACTRGGNCGEHALLAKHYL